MHLLIGPVVFLLYLFVFFSFQAPAISLAFTFFFITSLFLPMTFRALIGSVTRLSADYVSLVLNRSGVDLLLTGLADPAESGQKQARGIKKLYSSHQQTNLGWSLSGPSLGSLASRSKAVPVRLYQMLLFTLPGTPVFSAGDEVGLKTGVSRALNKWGAESVFECKIQH